MALNYPPFLPSLHYHAAALDAVPTTSIGSVSQHGWSLEIVDNLESSTDLPVVLAQEPC